MRSEKRSFGRGWEKALDILRCPGYSVAEHDPHVIKFAPPIEPPTLAGRLLFVFPVIVR